MTQEAHSFRCGLTRREMLTSAVAIAVASKARGADEPKIRVVAEGLMAPEGPKPLADGSVVVVEMARGTLSRVMPNGEIRVVADLGGSPNGCAVGPDGVVYVANNGGAKFRRDGNLLVGGGQAGADPSVTPRAVTPSIHRVDLKTGAHRELYVAANGTPLGAPNDLVFDRRDSFYFSDVRAPGGEMPGGVFWAKTDGSEVRRLANVPSANGIALSPDRKRLYVCAPMQIIAFDVVGEGRLAVGPDGVAKSQVFGSIQMGRFDSMATEADGGLVAATLAGTMMSGALTVFAPDGKVRESIPLPPERNVTNVGFGGPDLKTAYVTLTQTGKLIAIPWPRKGLKLVNQ